MRTPAENEAFVRQHWETTSGIDLYGYGITLPTRPTHSFVGYEHKRDAWAAAAEFTEQRLKDIRQVEMELALLRGLLFLLSAEPGDMTAPIWERVIVREQAALESLKKGMRA